MNGGQGVLEDTINVSVTHEQKELKMESETQIIKTSSFKEPQWFNLTDDLEIPFGLGGIYFVEVAYLSPVTGKRTNTLGVLNLTNYGKPVLHAYVGNCSSLQQTHSMFRKLTPMDVYEVKGRYNNDDIPF